MRTVEFKFGIDQEVKTRHGDVGIIAMLGYDAGGRQYFVKTRMSAEWWYEHLLEEIDE